jgi:hypothetical protein
VDNRVKGGKNGRRDICKYVTAVAQSSGGGVVEKCTDVRCVSKESVGLRLAQG